MTSIDSEKALLGVILQNPDSCVPYCADHGVKADHFIVAVHSEIYREVMAFFLEGKAVDGIAIFSSLRHRGVTGAEVWMLSEFQTSSCLPLTIGTHVDILKREKVAREFASALAESTAKTNASTIYEDISQLSDRIGQLVTGGVEKQQTTKEAVLEIMRDVHDCAQGLETAIGISTGVPWLDLETPRLKASDYWLIAGAAKAGKSTLALNFLKSLAVDNSKRCLFIGLEMPVKENLRRLLCLTGSLSCRMLEFRGVMPDHEHQRLQFATTKVMQAPLSFTFGPFDLPSIISRIKQAKIATPDLFAVFVDYLQLVGNQGPDNREGEIAGISRQLRSLAATENILIVALAQLNDDGRVRESRAPLMDATTAVFVEFSEKSGIRKLKIPVQRNGKSNISAFVAYIGDQFKFAELAEDHHEEEKTTKPFKPHPNSRKR